MVSIPILTVESDYEKVVLDSIPDCGGILTEVQGFFASPNYPSHYSNSLDCEWVIRCLFYLKPSSYAYYKYKFPLRLNISTNTIKITFTTFDIEDDSSCG